MSGKLNITPSPRAPVSVCPSAKSEFGNIFNMNLFYPFRWNSNMNFRNRALSSRSFRGFAYRYTIGIQSCEVIRHICLVMHRQHHVISVLMLGKNET